MNKTYRLLFNKALGVMQVVSELAKSSNKGASESTGLEVELPSKFKKQILVVALVSFCGAISGPVFAQTFPGGNGGSGSTGYGGSGLGAGGGGSGGTGGSIYGGGGGGGGVSGGGNGGGVSGGYGTGGSGAVGATYVNGSPGTGNGGGGGGGSTKLLIDALSGVVSTSQNITGGAGGHGSSQGQGGGGGGGGGVYAGAGSYLVNTTLGVISGGAGGASGANGGQGGGGGAGVAGNNFTLINMGSIEGGSGGFAVNGSGGGGAGIEVISGLGVIITNSVGGTIIGVNAVAGGTSGTGIQVDSGGSITALTNNSLIIGGAGFSTTVFGLASGSGGLGISNAGTITKLTNSGSIIGGDGGSAPLSGNGGDGRSAIYNAITGTINTLNNSGSLIGGAGGTLSGQYGNAGSPGYGMENHGSITSLINSGTISGGIFNLGTITTIVNTGTINGIGAFDGSINSISNLQGASSTPLALQGILPNYYNIIIMGTSNYGKLSFSLAMAPPGQTTFGISPGSVVTNHTYAAVLSGVALNSSYSSYAGYLTTLSGNYGSALWALTPEGVCTDNCIFDLTISGYYSGPSTADTQQSLVNTSQALQSTYTLQNSVLTNSFSYDCNEFGANGICISAGGRNTAVSAANGLNSTSGLLIAAYRPHANYRIGAYVDQNLSVNNAGSTVNLGNNTPLIGLFGAWNERLDGTGAEVKVSAAYGQKNTTVTRSVVGTSEAGSGSSQLNSQGAQVVAKYGFGVIENIIVSPYVGVRYTQNNMGGYTEGTSATVTAPLTYAALNTNATTALAGLGASYHFIPKATVYASAGVETDINTANGTYSATGISGLTPINFNANPVKTRPTATLGAYYDVEKNQRVGINGIYRQEPFQAVSTTTVMATYTVGL